MQPIPVRSVSISRFGDGRVDNGNSESMSRYLHKRPNPAWAVMVTVLLAGQAMAWIELGPEGSPEFEEGGEAGIEQETWALEQELVAYRTAMVEILADSPDPRRRAMALMLSEPRYCHQEPTADRGRLLASLLESTDPMVLTVAYLACDRNAAGTIAECDKQAILDRLAEVAPDNVWISLRRLRLGDDEQVQALQDLRRQLQGNPYHRAYQSEMIAAFVELREAEKHLPEEARLDPDAARDILDRELARHGGSGNFTSRLRRALDESIRNDPLYLTRRSPVQLQLFLMTTELSMARRNLCEDPDNRKLCARVIELMLDDDLYVITPFLASGLARRYLDEDDPLRRQAASLRADLDEWRSLQAETAAVDGSCWATFQSLYMEEFLLELSVAGELMAHEAMLDRLPDYCEVESLPFLESERIVASFSVSPKFNFHVL